MVYLVTAMKKTKSNATDCQKQIANHVRVLTLKRGFSWFEFIQGRWCSSGEVLRRHLRTRGCRKRYSAWAANTSSHRIYIRTRACTWWRQWRAWYIQIISRSWAWMRSRDSCIRRQPPWSTARSPATGWASHWVKTCGWSWVSCSGSRRQHSRWLRWSCRGLSP